ncbi:hypothetical protein AVEN_27795-1 [Araneus ventricosus]|uniref:Uncharacterized protein n=1 Tax=Araneus ventricosus TaxID=182803 RepID=A0A4Y2ELI4_ARAVE|nr:hypothetical protein AVEN_27795-1 [Araneus ventricosus]
MNLGQRMSVVKVLPDSFPPSSTGNIGHVKKRYVNLRQLLQQTLHEMSVVLSDVGHDSVRQTICVVPETQHGTRHFVVIRMNAFAFYGTRTMLGLALTRNGSQHSLMHGSFVRKWRNNFFVGV